MNTSTELIADYNPHAAFIYRDHWVVTQEQFLSEAYRLAHKLPEGVLLINFCHDRYYFALAFAAALIKGSTSLLLPNRQSGTLAEVLLEFPNSICVLDHDESPAVDSLDVRVDYSDLEPVKYAPELPYIKDDLVAAIALTSGSTGKPKALEKPWSTLAGTARRLGRRFDTSGSSYCISATVPSQHMYGLEMTVLMALQAGCSLNCAHPFFPKDILTSLCATPEPRLFVSTPVHLRVLQESGLEPCRVSKIVSATAPLSTELATKTELFFGGRLDEIYGFTEAGSVATRRPSDTLVWQLLDNMSIREVKGSIAVEGQHLKNAQTVTDVVELIDDRTFCLLGRSNDMLNIAGKRSSLVELNLKLLGVTGVEDGIVFLTESEGERPVALVVTRRTVHDISQELANSIDPVFLPRPIKKVSHLPRNSTGKIPSKSLNELWMELE